MKDFKKYYTISASPDEVYLALTTASTIHLWTGEVAEMSAVPGSEFSLWDGSIVGKNIEFETGKKIVQQWYFETQPAESIVTFKLHAVSQGTSVELKHVNIPDEDYVDIVDGWDNIYFASLVEFYEK
ncbi:MAG: SRPBCC domain-containing protein [Cyclobacteriaceae bacterium]|jgi:activator of HSP90 ATPase|nr:SRPBCC domain-containing protein [Cyclobacteriaceae bacterium]MDH5249028.1 SRPBCC domain-containing protein [Cyclobacteriaceae bacterium]